MSEVTNWCGTPFFNFDNDLTIDSKQIPCDFSPCPKMHGEGPFNSASTNNTFDYCPRENLSLFLSWQKGKLCNEFEMRYYRVVLYIDIGMVSTLHILQSICNKISMRNV